jgi:hypothetical protein
MQVLNKYYGHVTTKSLQLIPEIHTKNTKKEKSTKEEKKGVGF